MKKQIESRLFLAFLSIMTVVLTVGNATAQDAKLDVSGNVKVESIMSEVHNSSFISKSPNANYSKFQFLTRVGINTRYDLEKFRFSSNGRMIIGEGSNVANTRVGDRIGRLDELFIEYFPTISTGVFAGRRNMSYGQSRVINPSDVFHGSAKTKGTEKLGLEYFGETGYTVQAIWAPGTGYLNDGDEDKFYLSYHTLIGESYSDLLVFGLLRDRPGGGISVASTTETGLVLYSDFALWQGEELPAIHYDNVSGSYSVLPIDDNDILVETTAGLNYEFVNGLSANIEYTHLSDGYDSDQWTILVDAFSNSRSRDTLGKLYEIIRHNFLRQNYASFYLSHSDFCAKIEPSLSVLFNLHDFSNNWSLDLSRDLGDNYKINLELDRNFGRNSGEFNRSPENGTIRLSLVGYF